MVQFVNIIGAIGMIAGALFFVPVFIYGDNQQNAGYGTAGFFILLFSFVGWVILFLIAIAIEQMKQKK